MNAIDLMKEAAYERWQQESAERREVEKVILGERPVRARIGEMVKLGDDYAVQVIRGDEATWTTVVGGKRSPFHHLTQELAVLHLIARRHEERGADTAVIYAARVLGIPTE